MPYQKVAKISVPHISHLCSPSRVGGQANNQTVRGAGPTQSRIYPLQLRRGSSKFTSLDSNGLPLHVFRCAGLTHKLLCPQMYIGSFPSLIFHAKSPVRDFFSSSFEYPSENTGTVEHFS
jgi:hypothetical protein